MLCILFSSTILSSNVARRNMITIFHEASRCTRLRVTTESNFLFLLLASHEGENLIQIFTKLLSRDRPDEIQLGAAKWLVFHHSKFLLEDPVVLENSWHFSAPARLRSDNRFSMLMTWLYKVLTAVLGLVKQVAIKHMHAVGTVGPFKLAVHVAQNCPLESKSRTGTRQTKDIHYFKW